MTEPSNIPPTRNAQTNHSQQKINHATENIEEVANQNQTEGRSIGKTNTSSAQSSSQISKQPVKKSAKIKKIKVVPNIQEAAANDTLYGSSGHDFFVYRPGDGLLRIEDAAGVNILVLKQIHHDQIRVNIRTDGFLVVTYNRKPIVEMCGIDYIQVDQGVFPVEDWIVM